MLHIILMDTVETLALFTKFVASYLSCYSVADHWLHTIAWLSDFPLQYSVL